MKRLGIVLLCIIVFSSTILNAQEIPRNIADNLDSSNGSISVRIPLGTVTHTETQKGDEVTIDTFGTLLIPGKPALPSKIFSIAIPPGAVFVGLQYTIGGELVFPDRYWIAPVPVPQVNSQSNEVIQRAEEQRYTENFIKTYSVDAVYPQSIVEFERTAGFRSYNLVDVRINPLRYEPFSGKLTYYPDIMVYVYYRIRDGFTADDIVYDDEETFEKRARDIVLNYETAQKWYPPRQMGTAEYPFVILTLESLTSRVADLVTWEQFKGKNVQVVTTSWVETQYIGYDLAEKIRNFLREKYPSEQWGIQDLLIIGHPDDIPMRETWQDIGGGHPETDFYYAELTSPDNLSWDADGDHQYGENTDPIDFYGEIAVGRIPWSDQETVEHICQKSVNYEKNNDPSFKNNILFLAAFIDQSTDGATFMEYMANATFHPWMAYWSKTRLYEFQSHFKKDYVLTHTNVVNVWSSGKYAFVSWHAHGSPTGTAFIQTSDCQYLNDEYPAIVSAASCSNSDPGYLNIGQVMMKQGAVGFLGATNVAYYCTRWNDPNDGSDQSMKYFFKSSITSENYTQGQAHQYAISEMYTKSLWINLYYETFIHSSLWGSPDLAMKSYVTNTPPTKPLRPDGPLKGKIRVEHTYTSSTTDADDDSLYYFFSWGDGCDSGWLGPYASGGEVEASHSWASKNSYEIKVITKDSNGTKSVWSDPLSIDMPLRGLSAPSLLQVLKIFLQNHPFLFPLVRLFIHRIT